MPYRLVNNKNSMNIEDIILLSLLVFLMYYMFCNKSMRESEKFTENDIKKVISIDKLKCSKKCCKWNQWPVPFFTPDKDAIPTNLMCNHGNGSGCVCMTQEALDHLKNRGGNSK